MLSQLEKEVEEAVRGQNCEVLAVVLSKIDELPATEESHKLDEVTRVYRPLTGWELD